jgi:hypothetical protein
MASAGMWMQEVSNVRARINRHFFIASSGLILAEGFRVPGADWGEVTAITGETGLQRFVIEKGFISFVAAKAGHEDDLGGREIDETVR